MLLAALSRERATTPPTCNIRHLDVLYFWLLTYIARTPEVTSISHQRVSFARKVRIKLLGGQFSNCRWIIRQKQNQYQKIICVCIHSYAGCLPTICRLYVGMVCLQPDSVVDVFLDFVQKAPGAPPSIGEASRKEQVSHENPTQNGNFQSQLLGFWVYIQDSRILISSQYF